MANDVKKASVIANAALAVLENELGWMKKLYRAHESEYKELVNGYKKGSTITIRKPADPRVRVGATASAQDVVEGSTTLVVDTQIGHDFQFTSAELALDITELTERIIKPAMFNIVNYMASDISTAMYRGAYNWAGTPGQTVNSYSDFTAAPKRLDLMAVPQDDRCALLSVDDHWALVGAATTLNNTGAENSAYRKGSLGMLGNIDTYMSQLAPTHTVGALGGTPLVNGASQNVTFVTAKDTWTQSLITDGWSNSVTGLLKAGDIFTIAGVYMVNPKTQATTGVLQQFVVTADASSNGTGQATLTISPPIITSGAHMTCNAAPADNAAITVLGTAATAYTQNLAFHKNAMALAVVPLELPDGATGGARESYKGFSCRVQPYYDGANDISKWRLDILYGKKLIDPRLITRFSGTP